MDKPKITIATLVDKNEDFIELQYNSIKKFVKNDVEYIVFNNTSDPARRSIVNDACKKLGIKAYELTDINYKATTTFLAQGMNQIWDKYIKDMTGLLMFIDSDMFFISEIDLQEIGREYDIMYVPQYRENCEIEYVWVGVFMINLDRVKKTMNFYPFQGKRERTDLGGSTHEFLKEGNYKKLYIHFYTLIDASDSRLEVSLNGCGGYTIFKDGVPENQVYTTRFFPHEKEDINYLESYKMEFENHLKLAEEYNFPHPYTFDLVKIVGSTKPFMFHYKSANWEERYGVNHPNAHAIMKKESLKRMLENE